MKTTAAIALAGLAALVCADSVRAHHSGYVYQTTPLWIGGTVTRFELKNPHTIATLETRSEDGQARLWAIEGPSQTGLNRRSGRGEYLPRVGDQLEVCAFPYKPVDEIARDSRLVPSPDISVLERLDRTTTESASPRLVAGYALVTSNQAIHLWEPHGFISECIRGSSHQRQFWIDFLNANSRAHELWCSERTAYGAIQSNASFHELVEELNALLAEPCK